MKTPGRLSCGSVALAEEAHRLSAPKESVEVAQAHLAEHREWCRQEGVDLIEGNPSPRLTDKQNAAVDFARIVGRRPAGVTDEMTDTLRAFGWTDAEIVEIVASVALMRYTTTVASALDVPLEEAMEGVGVSCGVPLDRLEG